MTNPRDSYPKFRELPKAPGMRIPNAWGVFGADDELGTLNHLDATCVIRGAETIRLGQVVNLNLPLDQFDPPLISHRGFPRHDIFGLNEFHRDDRIDNFFPQSSTQLDGLRHFAHPDLGFYNGALGEELKAGTRRLGIQNVAQRGIAGRAVLLDVEKYRASIDRRLDHAKPDTISLSDLLETVKFHQLKLHPGDILLIRTGWLAYIKANGVSSPLLSTGLMQEIGLAEWIWDSKFSMVAADNLALEVWPADENAFPTMAEQQGGLSRSHHTGMLHRILIPLLGVTIGELWDLDYLAQLCHELNRYEFFVTAEPLNMTGGVGSPANALAIF